jgi:hypothetical protein
MALLNYSTTVPAAKTAGEVTRDLVKAGARAIATEYDANGRAIGMTFAVVVRGDTLHYSLPVRIGAVRDVLVAQKVERRYQTAEHAERVAWRILRDWVRAQLAIIETEMVSLEQVMLPYLRTDTGQTVFERYQENRLQITGPEAGA